MKADKVVGREIDAAALKYQRAHPEVSYSQALEAALAEYPDLAKEFVAEFGHLPERTVKQYGIEDAGDEDAGTISAEKEIDRLVQAWLADHPTEKDNYSKGLQIVLARHPDLKMRWTKNYNPAVRKFEHVVTVEHEEGKTEDDKKASATIDALVKKIQAEHPNWTLEQCMGEARARLKKKGEKIDELSEEVETAHARLREHMAS